VKGHCKQSDGRRAEVDGLLFSENFCRARKRSVQIVVREDILKKLLALVEEKTKKASK